MYKDNWLLPKIINYNTRTSSVTQYYSYNCLQVGELTGSVTDWLEREATLAAETWDKKHFQRIHFLFIVGDYKK